MTPCCSGRHFWFEKADAECCCNPRWKRCLRVGTRECVGRLIAVYSHYWLEVKPETTQGEKPEEQ